MRIGECDQSHLQSIRRFADRFTAQVPRLDGLVNNAGVLTQERGFHPTGSEADNRCVTPASQALPGAAGNPVLVQGRFGRRGNFELVTAGIDRGPYHTWRNNDNAFLTWGVHTVFGQSLPEVAGVAMIESNFGSPGNLEVVCNAGGQYSRSGATPAQRSNGTARTLKARLAPDVTPGLEAAADAPGDPCVADAIVRRDTGRW